MVWKGDRPEDEQAAQRAGVRFQWAWDWTCATSRSDRPLAVLLLCEQIYDSDGTRNACVKAVQFSATIETTPQTALIDESVSIRLLGFQPNKSVTLRATMPDDLGRVWSAYATFKPDDEGNVDLSSMPPDSGSYSGIDSMGLFWSMTLEDTAGALPMFIKTGVAPTTVSLIAEVDGNTVATASLERLFVAADVSDTSVRQEGLVGELFAPPGDNLPAVLVVTGSDGGFGWAGTVAPLLASHGYAALALAYFDYQGMEGLPTSLMEIPLEYFERAIAWMGKQPQVNREQLAVVGISRGGELALLLGSTFPEIKSVVAYVPSGVVWQSFTIGASDAPRSSWTYQGKPVPFVPFPEGASFTMDGKTQPRQIREVALKNQSAVAAAMIPVEKINGSVMLISGTADFIWPSDVLSEMVVNRLMEHQHLYPVKHLCYQDVGHGFSVPYLPMALIGGGNPQENAIAGAEAWSEMLDFLAQPQRIGTTPR
ncbi:acyl-CoA thioesterase/BAAT N-terminal domain-containing protein [Microcoleus sp. FACHB-53]|nr:acyl-CoA thioesterase/BAAT N-terminal domain-containing protein [Microcoleus sp. FACHB-53]